MKARKEGKIDPSLVEVERAMEILNKRKTDYTLAKEEAEEEYQKELDKINSLSISQKEKDRLSAQAKNDVPRRIYEIMEQHRPTDIVEDSANYGRRVTYNYRPEGWLGAVARGINMTAENFPPLRLVIPFTNIIANVANETINYTPLGYVRAFRKSGHILPVNAEPITDEQKADMLAKASLGLVLSSTLMLLAGMGSDDDDPVLEITGTGYGDYKKNYNLKDQKGRGWQQYSFRIKNPTTGEYGPWISYQYTPLVVMFAALGNYQDYKRYVNPEAADQEMQERFAHAIKKTATIFFDSTFLTSINDFLSSIMGNEAKGDNILDKVGKWAQNTSKSFVVPNFYTQAAKEVQNSFEMPIKDVRNSILGSFLTDVPFARNMYKDRLNVLGLPIYPDTDRFISAPTDDKYVEYLDKYHVTISEPRRNQEFKVGPKGEQRPLNDDEWYKYTKTRGEYIRSNLDRRISNRISITQDQMSEIASDASRMARNAISN
jgi:ribosomal protein S19E (S16A)